MRRNNKSFVRIDLQQQELIHLKEKNNLENKEICIVEGGIKTLYISAFFICKILHNTCLGLYSVKISNSVVEHFLFLMCGITGIPRFFHQKTNVY